MGTGDRVADPSEWVFENRGSEDGEVFSGGLGVYGSPVDAAYIPVAEKWRG